MDPNSRGHYEHTWCRSRVFQSLIVASSYKKVYLYFSFSYIYFIYTSVINTWKFFPWFSNRFWNCWKQKQLGGFLMSLLVKESIVHKHPNNFPTDIYLLKVKGKNISTRCKICSKLTITRVERRHWRRSGVFIVNLNIFRALY